MLVYQQSPAARLSYRLARSNKAHPTRLRPTNMSFGALPTELDVAMIRYLKCSDISRLSRSSKYYREVAEPLLYESIHFWTDEPIKLKKLFLTLVFRKPLRGKIHHFGIHHEPESQHDVPFSQLAGRKTDEAESDLCEDLMANAKEIHTAVSDLAAQHGLSSQLSMSIFAKVFEPLPSFDSCLALILCMVTQLRTLNLDMHGEALETTELLLASIDWRDTCRTFGGRPLHALQDLCMQAGPSAYDRFPLLEGFQNSMLPSLKHLTIRNNNNLHISNWNHGLADAKLRTLTLEDVYFHPSMLRRIFQLPSSRTIERLTISGLENVATPWTYMASIWTADEYRKIKETMLEHLPKLRYFRWTGMGNWGKANHFGPFLEFRKLEELVIDYAMLSSNFDIRTSNDLRDWDEILDYFPPTLAILELSEFSWHLPQRIYRQYIYETRHEARSEELSQIYTRIAALPMKEIFLNVTFCHERHRYRCGVILPPADDQFLMFLKTMSEQLDGLGTKFTVWHQTRGCSLEPELLVGPSYFAPECYENCCEDARDRYRAESPLLFDNDDDYCTDHED